MTIRAHVDQLRKTIVDEVFLATGRKVDHDDPIVSAALVQSAFMATASDLVAKKIMDAADELTERATRSEMAIKEAHARNEYVQLGPRLDRIAADLRMLSGRVDMLGWTIAWVFGGGIVLGGLLLLLNFLA